MAVEQTLTNYFPKCLGLYFLPEPDMHAALCPVRFDLVLKEFAGLKLFYL